MALFAVQGPREDRNGADGALGPQCHHALGRPLAPPLQTSPLLVQLEELNGGQKGLKKKE